MCLKAKEKTEQKNEKKKKSDRLEFQYQREPNAGTLSPSIMGANVQHVLVCRTHIHGGWRGLEGNL